VLLENVDLLKNIAQHLLDIETLTKEDIYEIVETGKLSWWEKKKLKTSKELKPVEPIQTEKKVTISDERVPN